MGKKIALLGTAPSSCNLAPFKDPSWTIWACSPGIYPLIEANRAEAFFELHRPEWPEIGNPVRQVSWFTPEYCAWLAKFSAKAPVYMANAIPQVPGSIRYPIEQMIAKYGPYFFTSSLSYMFALALDQQDVTEIGLWGVDMAANEEYHFQRPGCHFFITEAMRRGIQVIVPPESDLLQPKGLYGLGENNPMQIKLLARKRELEGRMAGVQQTLNNANAELHFLRGALDDLNYVYDTWTTDLVGLITKAQAVTDALIEPRPLSHGE